MSESKTVEGIVLKRRDFMEADRIFTLFSKEMGVIDVIARGSRKAGAKLATATEPLFAGKIQIAIGKKNNILTQYEPLNSYSKIRTDYDLLTHTFAMLEIFSAVNIPGSISEKAYRLLEQSLNYIIDDTPVLNTMLWSGVHLLDIEGLSPSWVKCIATEEVLSEDPAWFSVHSGGYILRGHESSFRDKILIPAKALITYHKLSSVECPPKKIKDIEMCWYYLAQIWKSHAHQRMPAIDASIALCNKK